MNDAKYRVKFPHSENPVYQALSGSGGGGLLPVRPSTDLNRPRRFNQFAVTP